MKVRTSEEVRAFLRTLAPEPRRAILRALDKLEAGGIEPLALEAPLEKFCKVRAGRFRLICAIERNTIFALFAERRAIVYEVVSATLLEEILRRQS
jgi:mRNA-degrading endonuclease RelE of RelBE toxin-antitoxin system